MSDPGRLALRQLTGTPARIFMWLYLAAQTVFAVWTLDAVRSPWPTLVALLLFAGVCLALARDTGQRLSPPVTLLAAVVGPVSALLICWQLTTTGFALWFTGAASVLLFYISLRGRIAVAWASIAAMAVVTTVWGATTRFGALTGLLEVATQVPVLVVGTLFAIGLRRTGDQIVLLTEQTAARAALEAAAAATAAERDARLAAIDEVATPLLARLAADPLITDAERTEFMVAEAQLRDSIRGRSLDLPEIVAAARDARRRGVTVMLLDDSGADALESADRLPVVRAITGALYEAKDGRVTARLLPRDREQLATILVDGSVYSKWEIAR